MIGGRGTVEQLLDGRHEIIGHGAADAAVGEFDDIVLAADIAAAFQDFTVDADIAELVDEEGDTRPPAFSSMWRMSVVLPAPRKPVMTVVGILPVLMSPTSLPNFCRAMPRNTPIRHHSTADAAMELAAKFCGKAGGHGRFMGERLWRADDVGKGNEDHCDGQPDVALGGDEVDMPIAGGDDGADPPDLPRQQIGSGHARQFRRKPSAGARVTPKTRRCPRSSRCAA